MQIYFGTLAKQWELILSLSSKSLCTPLLPTRFWIWSFLFSSPHWMLPQADYFLTYWPTICTTVRSLMWSSVHKETSNVPTPRSIPCFSRSRTSSTVSIQAKNIATSIALRVDLSFSIREPANTQITMIGFKGNCADLCRTRAHTTGNQ